MNFRKYQHIERLGSNEVQSILDGKCYVFYKIDGTNASVWLNDDGELRAGSRTRELTAEADNANFYKTIVNDENVLNYLKKHPTHRLYGEFLVPHALKTYDDMAWRKFYIFDVVKDIDEDKVEYLTYETYKPLLEEFNLNYIPPIMIIDNPTVESIYNCLDKTNQFLVKDGAGFGEGIVIKNYDFYNRYGRQTWGKVIHSEFKERKETSVPEITASDLVELKIVEEFCTKEFIEKEFAKLVTNNGGEWHSKMIPILLNVVYYELVREESWNFVKKFKNPTINYKTLQGFVMRKVKDVKKDVFK